MKRVELQHLIHIRPVARWLEGVGLEAGVVVGEVEGKCVQRHALRRQLTRRNRRDHTGIYPAREKAANGHV